MPKKVEKTTKKAVGKAGRKNRPDSSNRQQGQLADDQLQGVTGGLASVSHSISKSSAQAVSDVLSSEINVTKG